MTTKTSSALTPKMQKQASTLRKFISDAKRDGRSADVAYGAGALDATLDRPADGERYGSNHREYLAGWCRVHGI